MSISINRNECTGCGRCIAICPGGIIRRDPEKKAYLKRPQDCWSCTSCMKVCPAGAVCLYLPAELGGRGGQMTLKKTGTETCWTVTRRDGSAVSFTTSAETANRY
ncbi:MAG: 4Fe-4S dicluster domain-containing protein [Eubacterium sp.]|nr:4Fe-4S dicluster domain-containing protein [Eubacterium sp.]MBQ9322577.1 4Fe-4S dicluster domain-containing protein [Eubacterium sp.]